MLRSDEGPAFRVIILDRRDRVLAMRPAVRITGSDDLWQCVVALDIQRCMQ